MSLMNVFSPLNGGTLDTYNYGVEYPFDLDAGLDYTRPATGFAPFPFPVVLGYVSGFVPLMDGLERAIMKGQMPTGPVINMIGNPAMQNAAFPNVMGSLAKVKG